MTTTVYSII
uniref:Uncharacterized protein n=1 Tax=Rhizophora mucronata TaxID=61149 RepID=A0A2P2Q1A2_RHIMU